MLSRGTRRKGAGPVGLLLAVVQPVAIGVRLEGIGGDPGLRAVGQLDLPAAYHRAALVTADFLSVREAVAVRVGDADLGAEEAFQAVAQPVAVAVGVQQIAAVRRRGLKLIGVREAIAVGVPDEGVRAEGQLPEVQQTVAIQVGVGQLRPLPQLVQGGGQDVQEDLGRVVILLWDLALRDVAVDPRIAPKHVRGPDGRVEDLGHEAACAVDLRRQGKTHGGGIVAVLLIAIGDDLAVQCGVGFLGPEGVTERLGL
jgi:hypothetical protein